ncbi:type III secretion system cytoplasmic ring protein SctQ [Cupriavidus gilardii]|uniref:type III secretion system cytoplasmic ring protein SctQ n=1 Tax=Cupriavidus gilardii TaxID=82541 RepID=UPI001ABDFFB2|nr:type III secretion system cytoplasmic ring protein SctQ [Cupriavidus gilardii]MBO4123468.1 type III secretion system cytoplasmic ring protein SctQ [Cupriavidus gilardii]
MLLDEWSDQDLELARAIGPGRSTAAAGDRRAGAAPGAHGDGLDALQALERLDRADPMMDPIGRLDAFDGDRLRHDPLAGLRDDDGDGDRDPGIGDIGKIGDIGDIGDTGEIADIRDTSGRNAPNEDGAAALVLDLKPCGGDGVVLTMSIDGQRARAWVDADAWCEWLAPRLAVQRFHQIPPDLLGLLGQWTLLPLQHHARRAGLGLPRFGNAEPGRCARAIAPTLTLCRADAELDLRLLDWPEPWIAALAQTMEDRRPPLTIPPIPVALAAGWVHLTRAQLARLAPGDGVVLERAAAVEHGHAWLIAERPLALACFAHGAWHIEHTCNEETSMEQGTEVTLRGSQLDDDNIVLTAVAEVGRLSLSLDTLRELQTGQMLELAHASHGRVTLTVSGQPVANGTLLRVGDKLVMRIE